MVDSCAAKNYPPTMVISSRVLQLLIALCCLVFALPAFGQREPSPVRPPQPGEGGDATLPAGYKGVVWGASAEAIMAILGGMEVQATPDPHLRKLIELPPPGSEGDGMVRHWTLWDDKLVEVTMFFPGPFTLREGRELREAFENKYGPARLEKISKGVERGSSAWDVKVEKQIVEKRWLWQDPFTIQMLKNDVLTGQWINIRQSRMFEASRNAQAEQERKEAQSKKVKSIILD
ncbi:MAG: hypothetical protein CMP23_09110 [Rickettsiales bacterium]|nr:hypothetical protein [Rickettsiales bacterium]